MVVGSSKMLRAIDINRPSLIIFIALPYVATSTFKETLTMP